MVCMFISRQNPQQNHHKYTHQLLWTSEKVLGITYGLTATTQKCICENNKSTLISGNFRYRSTQNELSFPLLSKNVTIKNTQTNYTDIWNGSESQVCSCVEITWISGSVRRASVLRTGVRWFYSRTTTVTLPTHANSSICVITGIPSRSVTCLKKF
jgi:hypothetical protein